MSYRYDHHQLSATEPDITRYSAALAFVCIIFDTFIFLHVRRQPLLLLVPKQTKTKNSPDPPKLYFESQKIRNRKIKWPKSEVFSTKKGGLKEAGPVLYFLALFHTIYYFI